MFPGPGRSNRLSRMFWMSRTNIDHVNLRICQHFLIVFVDPQGYAILLFELSQIMFPSRAHRANLGPVDLLECVNMSTRNPAQSNDSNSKITNGTIPLHKSKSPPTDTVSIN